MTLNEANNIRKVCLENYLPVPQVEVIDNDSTAVRICFSPSIKFELRGNARALVQAMLNEKKFLNSNEDIGVAG